MNKWFKCNCFTWATKYQIPRFCVQREPENMIKSLLAFKMLIFVWHILNPKLSKVNIGISVSCFLYLSVYCIVITFQIYQIFIFAKHVKNIEYFSVLKQILLCDNDTSTKKGIRKKIEKNFWLKYTDIKTAF